jgi:rifampicin phosphotransferase
MTSSGAFPNDCAPSHAYSIYGRDSTQEVFPEVVSPMSGSLLVGTLTKTQTRWLLKTGSLSKHHFSDGRSTLWSQFHGHMYANVSLLRVAALRAPGGKPEDVEKSLETQQAFPEFKAQKGDRSLFGSLRLTRFAMRAFRQTDSLAAQQAQRDVHGWVTALSKVETLNDHDLIGRLQQLPTWLQLTYGHEMTVGMHAASLRVGIEQLSAVTGQPHLANRITAGFGEVESAQQVEALWELSRMDGASLPSAVDIFATRFGHYGPAGLELASPKWGTDQDLVFELVEGLKRTPTVKHHDNNEGALRHEAIREVRSRLSGSQRNIFDSAVNSAATYIPEREQTKAALLRVLTEGRRALLELARRHCPDPAQIFFLTEAELAPFVASPKDFEARLTERQLLAKYLRQRMPPVWFSGAPPDPSTWTLRALLNRPTSFRAAQKTFIGIGASSGVATGRARVMRFPSFPLEGFRPSDILVAPHTDSAWTPLFLAVGGVVTEVGSAMSHAAVVARELGIPSVTRLQGATANIVDGSTITVDGDRGTVTVR